jgi:isoquinoline 1-oxidoreductase beta subunit
MSASSEVHTDPRLTRRGFLQATGLTFGFVVGLPPRDGAASSSTTAETLAPNIWVNIAPNGIITIINPSVEMGQGTMTALPIIVAEELDAEWSDVRIETSPSDDGLYGNPGYAGILRTGASATLAGYYDTLRLHGAQARRVLLDSAAARWSVPVEELATEPSVVVHSRSGRRLTYGEVAGFTTMPASPPDIEPRDLKDPSEFRLIGHDIPRADIPAKVDGSAQYSMDVRLPGMVYATVLRPPVRGALPEQVSEGEARKIPGVLDVVRLPYGVGVVSETVEGALAAQGEIEIEWQQVAGSAFDSDAELAAQANRAREMSRDGASREDREVEAALTAAPYRYQTEYSTEFVYQAQMEPLNAVASVTEDGQRAEVWAGSQTPTYLLRTASKTLDIPVENITHHRMYLGGGFGRRSDMRHEYVVDALLLSRAVGKPVKLVWSREDDVRYGHFKPSSAHYLQAGVDDQDRVTAWEHRSVTDNVQAQADPYLRERWSQLSQETLDALTFNRDRDLGRYQFGHRRRETDYRALPVRLGWMRGISTLLNEFAAESFLDEITADRGLDPMEFRLAHLSEPLARSVLDTVAKMANWTDSGDRGLGISYVSSFGCLMATVAEVSVDRDNGWIRVPDIWVAIDIGIPVQPLNVVGQVESCVVYALSNALTERISFKDGRVQQSNFHDYPVITMADTPQIHVTVVRSERPPTGVGDRAGLGVAPAVANGFARLTGRRLRHMPMTPERVLEALA